MQAETEHPRFSDFLHELSSKLEARGPEMADVTLRELIDIVGPKGHPFLALFLALPFVQPIPLPGISTLVGLSIALIGFFMALGRPPWLPERLGSCRLSREIVQKVCIFVERIAAKMERWLKPRGLRIFSRAGFSRWIGGFLALLGALLSLPLPIPVSNALPAWTIVFLSLALLEEDILVLLFGLCLFLTTLAFFAAIFVLPVVGIRWLS